MNRSIYIIMVTALLVALGYILMFRHIGVAPGYLQLMTGMVVFFGVIWWLSRKAGRQVGSSPQ